MTKRPVFISIICILSFIGIVITLFALIPGLISPMGQVMVSSINYPPWYTGFVILSLLIYFFSLCEIWKMKKRGIELYTVVVIINYAVNFFAGYLTLSGSILSIIIIGIVWTQYNKMNLPSLLKHS